MRFLAFFLALVLAAGCFGDGGGREPVGTTGPSSDPSATSVPTLPAPPAPGPPVVDLLIGFAFEDCSGVSLTHPVPLADAQSLLPPGFTARTSPALDGAGTLQLDAYACGNLTASTARVPSTFYGQLSVPVEPPVDRVPGAPSAAAHEYVFRVLAGQDVLATLWPAAGYETRVGEATLRVGQPGEGVPFDTGVRTADGSVGEDYSFTASGLTSLAAPRTGSFARYTVVNDGSVLVLTGTYDFPDAYTGQGTFRVPDDDPFSRFQAGTLGPFAVLTEGGGMSGMDLRRVFTPP